MRSRPYFYTYPALYKDDCNIGATTFLLVHGGVGLVMSSVLLMGGWWDKFWNSRFTCLARLFFFLSQFAIAIWGAIIVFGNLIIYKFYDNCCILELQISVITFKNMILGPYNKVKIEDQSISNTSEFYCAAIPYYYSFVVLIIYFVLMPIVISLCQIFTILASFQKKRDWS